jgi:hypothetical protein
MKNLSRDSDGFTFFINVEWDTMVSGKYMYISMWVSLVPEQLSRFYSCSIFKSLAIIGLCPVNLNILAPKIW